MNNLYIFMIWLRNCKGQNLGPGFRLPRPTSDTPYQQNLSKRGNKRATRTQRDDNRRPISYRDR